MIILILNDYFSSRYGFSIKAFQDMIAFNTKLSYCYMETTLMFLMLNKASPL